MAKPKTIISNKNLDLLNKVRTKKCSADDLLAKSVLKHSLRDYQESALLNYLLVNNFLDRDIDLDIRDEFDKKHHCFHMATGSGKTMLMAYLIAHLYSKGYTKVLFITNSTTLLDKTKNNLIPSLSSRKCEFKSNPAGSIQIGNNQVQIMQVSSFSDDIQNIEIAFYTIQDLHSKIENPAENGLSLDDLKDKKILIIGDEAHHFNVATKTAKDDETNWEQTIVKILKQSKHNRLVEFSATMELANEWVADKYIKDKTKIIYDFTLKDFRLAGYSKEIELVQELDKEKRIAKAIISNYKKYLIASSNKISLIPRILFKSSGEIDDLKAQKDFVLDVVSKLSQFDKTLTPVQIKQIANLYNDSTTLVLHSKDKDKESKLRIVNEIDSNRTINMIFAIDMLNEGWDVLSLLDIVKLDDTNATATVSEAQLIGRGARIFPYQLDGLFSFKRRFDLDKSNQLRQLETLNFHSSTDSAYIKALKDQLKRDGLQGDDKEEKTTVKPKQEQVKRFGNYFVFTNQLTDLPNNDDFFEKMSELTITMLFKTYATTVNSADLSKETFTSKVCEIFPRQIHLFVKAFNCSTQDTAYIKQQTQKTTKALLEKLFVTNKYLFKSDVEYQNLELEQQFALISSLVDKVVTQLYRLLQSRKIGTSNFSARQLIKDLFVAYDTLTSKVKEENKDGELVDTTIYYHEKLSCDSDLELELHEDVFSRLDSKKYVVIRNEGQFKFYSPYSDNPGEGFEPDFIVLLEKSKTDIVQYYLEVKGSDKLISQKWKEDLLLKLKIGKPLVEENVTYNLYGFEFYTDKNKSSWISSHLTNNALT